MDAPVKKTFRINTEQVFRIKRTYYIDAPNKEEAEAVWGSGNADMDEETEIKNDEYVASTTEVDEDGNELK